MTKIGILGAGCPKCKKLHQAVVQLVRDEGIEAEVIKVEDIQEIVKRGVLMAPGLFVDG